MRPLSAVYRGPSLKEAMTADEPIKFLGKLLYYRLLDRAANRISRVLCQQRAAVSLYFAVGEVTLACVVTYTIFRI